MRVIGLTGNIGSGKSTVARMLAGRGLPVIDADRLSREVVEPGMPALREIEERFPGVVKDGALDRAALGARVFADPAERRALEAILHPRIAMEARRRLQAAEDSGHPVAIYEAALIVENSLQQGMDGLIVVTVPPGEQVKRVVSRDGLSEDAARARIESQLPQEKKVAVATLVLDNGGTLDALAAQVEQAVKVIGMPTISPAPAEAT
jgi:dephospho-CoA kinase